MRRGLRPRRMTLMFHPWQILPSLTGWTLLFAPLPDSVMGLTCWDSRTITLLPGMTQAQRRSTLTHELVHVEPGTFPDIAEAKEEAAVSREAARRLIPWDRLTESWKWTQNVHELADELWVDEQTVRARLLYLHPSERAHLTRMLEGDS